MEAGIPYSEAHQLEFGLTPIKSTRDFEKALGEWHAKPTHESIWDNLSYIFVMHTLNWKKFGNQ